MPDLKLAKLPDRTPVRITVTVTPELNAALRDYVEVYQSVYGEKESVAELVPFMLEAFLAGDRGFARARKERLADTKTDKPARRARSPRTGDAEAVSPIASPTSQTQEG